MKKNVKKIGLIVVISLSVIAIIYSLLKPISVETKTVTEETSEITFTETGTVKPIGIQTIYPSISGELEEIYVAAGDDVESGEILAQLNVAEVDLQIVQLTSQIKALNAQLESAKLASEIKYEALIASKTDLVGQLNRLASQLGSDGQLKAQEQVVQENWLLYERSLEDLQKYESLLEVGGISESEYRNYEAATENYLTLYKQSYAAMSESKIAYDTSKTSIEAQIEQIDQAISKDQITPTVQYYEAEIESANAELKRLNQLADRHQIKAISAGNIGSVLIGENNWVSSLNPAFTIDGGLPTNIEVTVSTRDIGAVKEGDEVGITLDQRTGDVTVKGTIKSISKSAVIQISPLGIEERKIPVLVQFEPTEAIKSGYFVDVIFTVQRDESQLVVPNSALYKRSEDDYVMVIERGKVKEVLIELGNEYVGETAVVKGLESGDVVVVDLEAKGLNAGVRATSSRD